MTTGIYDNCYTCWDGCPTNPSDVGGRLCPFCADANCIRLRLKTSVANIDIVTSRGQI